MILYVVKLVSFWFTWLKVTTFNKLWSSFKTKGVGHFFLYEVCILNEIFKNDGTKSYFSL